MKKHDSDFGAMIIFILSRAISAVSSSVTEIVQLNETQMRTWKYRKSLILLQSLHSATTTAVPRANIYSDTATDGR